MQIGGGLTFGTGITSITRVDGQQEYTVPGTYTWIAPTFVKAVSVVAVGGGGSGSGQIPGVYGGVRGGGGGGGLGYKNNIEVVSGQSYTVVVGEGGPSVDRAGGYPGGNSYFISNVTVCGGGGDGGVNPWGGPTGYGGSYVGDGGGVGGNGNYMPFIEGVSHGGAGGGAGGYAGNGGNAPGTQGAGNPPQTNSGGGGSGASSQAYGAYSAGGSGGGVGIYGIGADGTGGAYTTYPNLYHGGTGGSGGGTGGSGAGSVYNGNWNLGNLYIGGSFGGGGGAAAGAWSFAENYAANGAGGAVRIVWPGNTRRYPSTNTANVIW
jgi:hypothetical protein